MQTDPESNPTIFYIFDPCISSHNYVFLYQLPYSQLL